MGLNFGFYSFIAFSIKSFNTCTPATQSFSEDHSFGLWLMPSLLLTNSMATGICRPRTMASCPAPLGIYVGEIADFVKESASLHLRFSAMGMGWIFVFS